MSTKQRVTRSQSRAAAAASAAEAFGRPSPLPSSAATDATRSNEHQTHHLLEADALSTFDLDEVEDGLLTSDLVDLPDSKSWTEAAGISHELVPDEEQLLLDHEFSTLRERIAQTRREFEDLEAEWEGLCS